jgi:hypothetical protein
MIPSEVKVEMSVTKAEIYEIFRSEMCFIVDQTKCVTTLQNMSTLCLPLCKRIRLYLQHLQTLTKHVLLALRPKNKHCKAAFPPTARKRTTLNLQNYKKI